MPSMRSPSPADAARLLLLLLASVLAVPAPGEPTGERPPGELTFDDLFDPERTGRRPEQVAWRPDGEALTYVWDAGDGAALWSLAPEPGTTTTLLALAELPAGRGEDDSSESQEPGLDAYQWAPDGTGLVLESGGDLFWLPLGGGDPGPLARLTETEAAEEAPAISPDGRRVAYARAGDLYLRHLPTAPGEAPSTEIRLTSDGEPGRILNGTTDWVYWEEIWGRDATGFWWSPDSTRLAFYRFDDSAVGEHVLLPSYDDPYPEPTRQRYPKSGTTNPEVEVGVVDVSGSEPGEPVWLDTDGADESYLARVHWLGAGEAVDGTAPRLAIERLNRDQTELDLLLCTAAGAAAGSCRVVLEERHPTWINLGDETTFLPGGRLLWASERDGRRHLYLYRLEDDGPAVPLVQLTSGDWAVASVDHADASRALVTAHGEGRLGAARRRLLAVDLASGSGGGRVTELAGGDGWHESLPDPTGRRTLHGWSSANDPGWQRIESLGANGLEPTLAELPSTPPAYDPAALPSWEIFAMPADGGEATGDWLPAAILRPPGASGDAQAGAAPRHPVLMYHYGGPASQVVADRWASRGRGLWHKLMAQRGFGVLTVDNRASAFFGKAGEDRLHRRFGEIELAAQQAGVRYLGTLAWADAERVGLWGWSGGGSNTLYAMLRSPGTWRAGVAGAPVTDWRYYDTIWTERYLDHPEDNPEGYRDSSVVTHAERLADRLLIVHGTGDDNVHPQNTMALVRRWTAAGLPFEMAIYPGEKHGLKDAASRHFFERMTEFFGRTLGAAPDGD